MSASSSGRDPEGPWESLLSLCKDTPGKLASLLTEPVSKGTFGSSSLPVIRLPLPPGGHCLIFQLQPCDQPRWGGGAG